MSAEIPQQQRLSGEAYDSVERSAVASTSDGEQQPLLSSELRQHPEATSSDIETPLRSSAVPVFAKILTPILGLALGGTCLLFGLYILYIVLHIPSIMYAVRKGVPSVVSASLLDVAEDSVLFSAKLQFPNWTRKPTTIPYVNVTVFEASTTVGWVCAQDLVVGGSGDLDLYEVFHIVDQDAMERLLSRTAATRSVVLDARTVVDMRGFGSLLPTLSLRRKVAATLPPPPTVNSAIQYIHGPVVDNARGGVTAKAAVVAAIPMANISANIDAIELDVAVRNTTIASARIGPINLDFGGTASIPVLVNIKEIADSAHELALADMARSIAVGKAIALNVSGSTPDYNSTAPMWLRKALHKTLISLTTDSVRIPTGVRFPTMDAIKNVMVERLYAYWSAEDGFSPWVGVAGEVAIELPNPSNSNVFVEIESLIPHMQLLDVKDQVFATVDTPTIPLSVKQTAPLAFVASYDFEHLGLNVVPSKEKQFTNTIQRALVDRRLVVGINSTLDVVLATSIGRLQIDALPLLARIDHTFDSDANNDKQPSSHHVGVLPEPNVSRHALGGGRPMPGRVPELAVSRMHITNTTKDCVAMEIDLDVNNPFSYGAFMTDFAMHIDYAGLRIARIGFQKLALDQGSNKVTFLIDFYNHPEDPRQQMLFLDASSGKNITIEVSGFPNCTSIAPLEASLRDFTQKVTIDTSKLKDGSSGRVVSEFPKVLREVIFHLFSITTEATVINPVSGAGIWLQGIEAIGYYKEDIPLGTLQYDFTQSTQRIPASSIGLLLPFNQAATTPRMPIAANETSIGWDVLHRAIGGTLDVDVFTNIQILVGLAQFNVTVMGKNAPIKIRL
ncbi:hypothetical protein GGI07_005828 [Coemansia sp. Benny D115]|nr:hypothetical protein GGI07_005828 [Coemansia sp. Benny D115]